MNAHPAEVTLTPVGEIFTDGAHRVIADSQNLLAMLKDQNSASQHSIIFGTNYFFLPRIMTNLWLGFSENHPNVKVISRALPIELGDDSASADLVESTQYTAEPWKKIPFRQGF